MTSEDERILEGVAGQALELDGKGLLDAKRLTELSFDAYDVLYASLLDPAERAALVTTHYPKSRYLTEGLPLVDESLLAYYRGYHTAGFALLLVVLEQFLRGATGWSPGQSDPSFATLKNAATRFAPSTLPQRI